MNFRPLFIGAVLVALGLLFSQSPQIMPALPAKETATRDGKTKAGAQVDPAVVAVLRTAFAAQQIKGSYRALLDTSLGGNVLPSLGFGSGLS